MLRRKLEKIRPKCINTEQLLLMIGCGTNKSLCSFSAIIDFFGVILNEFDSGNTFKRLLSRFRVG